MMDTANAFRLVIEQAGLVPPSVLAPGKVTRFPGIGKSNGNKSGWAWLSEDGLGGAYGDWASGLSDTWHAQHDHAMTAAERAAHARRVAELRRIRKDEDAKQHAEAAARAQAIWDEAKPAPAAHPYLQKKHVQPHGLRLDAGGQLIVPVMVGGIISSVQFIDANGGKLFLPGGSVKDGSYTIGDLTEAAPILLLAESFGTGASLHEATSHPVVVAFSANALTPIAEELRQQYPPALILVCGDNDLHDNGTPNTGLLAATAAAHASKGVLVMPEAIGNKETDWNDVHVQCGLDAIRDAITTAIQREEMRTMERGAPDLSRALVSYTDLLALEIPERSRYLPWLLERSTVMVFGPRGIGKTFFQLALATALTTGKPLWKWACPQPVGVLYVDGEMVIDELRQRTTALMETPPIAPLNFLTSQLVYERCGGRDLVLTSDAMRQEVVKILDAHPDIRVVILDNISCLFSGLNEDSKQDWEPANAWLIRLRHRGITTVLVHHAGKGGQQRGTSGREDSLDTVIQLAQPTGGDARDGCHFELSFKKNRSVTGELVAPLDVRLETVNERLQWVWKPLEVSTLDRARLLVAEGVQGPTELAEELGINKGYASRILKKLKAEVS